MAENQHFFIISVFLTTISKAFQFKPFSTPWPWSHILLFRLSLCEIGKWQEIVGNRKTRKVEFFCQIEKIQCKYW